MGGSPPSQVFMSKSASFWPGSGRVAVAGEMRQ